MKSGDPRLDLATHIISTAFTLLYRYQPANIPKGGVNWVSGIKSPVRESYLRECEFEVNLAE